MVKNRGMAELFWNSEIQIAIYFLRMTEEDPA
jgi:hypothetical protein